MRIEPIGKNLLIDNIIIMDKSNKDNKIEIKQVRVLFSQSISNKSGRAGIMNYKGKVFIDFENSIYEDLSLLKNDNIIEYVDFTGKSIRATILEVEAINAFGPHHLEVKFI